MKGLAWESMKVWWEYFSADWDKSAQDKLALTLHCPSPPISLLLLYSLSLSCHLLLLRGSTGGAVTENGGITYSARGGGLSPSTWYFLSILLGLECRVMLWDKECVSALCRLGIDARYLPICRSLGCWRCRVSPLAWPDICCWAELHHEVKLLPLTSQAKAGGGEGTLLFICWGSKRKHFESRFSK